LRGFLLLFFVSLYSANAAILPRQKEINENRQKIFNPLVQKDNISCDEIKRIQNLSYMAYPNPYFLQRLRALLKIQRCDEAEILNPRELLGALKKIPKHMKLFKNGKWICPWFEKGVTRQGFDWQWVDLSSRFHPSF